MPKCLNFFHEDGKSEIVDGTGKKTTTFVVDASFCLTNLTNLHKYIKNKQVVTEIEEPKDTDMREEPSKKERSVTYNVYSNEDRRK